MRPDILYRVSHSSLPPSSVLHLYSQALLKSELDKQLQQGLIAGKHPQVLARDIRKAFNVSRSDAERLMRTELARVQTDAQMRSFEENGFEWYMFLSLGSRACEVCRALNGKKFKVKDMLISENAPPMHPNCRCSTAAYVDRNSIDWLKEENTARSNNKNVELPEELRSANTISESIKKGIYDALDGIEKTYGYQIPEIEYAPYTENVKAPFTFIPYQQNGMYKAKLNINTLFDWNENLECFNERIYNKNYKTGVLASRNMDDLILHETAHFKTFESCKTWNDFLQKEREVRNRYVPGVSDYNDSLRDGAETIAEGVVALRNGGVVPKEIKDLIEEYVRW